MSKKDDDNHANQGNSNNTTLDHNNSAYKSVQDNRSHQLSGGGSGKGDDGKNGGPGKDDGNGKNCGHGKGKKSKTIKMLGVKNEKDF